MNKGERDRQSRVKYKTITQITKSHGKQSQEASPASIGGEGGEASIDASLEMILAKIKDFQQDNKQQLEEIKEEISKTRDLMK